MPDKKKEMVEMLTPKKEKRLVYPEDVKQRTDNCGWKKAKKPK